MNFQINNYQDNPIDSANIYVVPDNSLNSEIKSNTFTSYSINNAIVKGKTDSNGQLCIANQSTTGNSPCTKVSIKSSKSISYLSQYSSNKNNSIFLDSKYFSKSNRYRIIITKNNYYSVTCSFSFSNFITNQILFNVSLKPFVSLSLNSLSIQSDIPDFPLNCHDIDFSFYTDNYSTPVSTIRISNSNFSSESNSIRINKLFTECYLPNGTFYLYIQTYDRQNRIIGISKFITVTIQNGNINTPSLYIKYPYYGKILCTIKADSTPVDVAGYTLYQIINNHYFYIDNLISTSFQESKSFYQTAFITLTQLQTNTDYYLIPIPNVLCSDVNYKFCTNDPSIITISPEAVNHLSPILTSECTINKKPSGYINKPDDFSTSNILCYFENDYFITQHMVRTSNSYPNTIIASYSKSGSFISASFFISNSINYSNYNKSFILDFFSNEKELITTQKTYH